MSHFRECWSTGWPMRSRVTLAEIMEEARARIPDHIGRDMQRDVERLSIQVSSDGKSLIVAFCSDPSMRIR